MSPVAVTRIAPLEVKGSTMRPSVGPGSLKILVVTENRVLQRRLSQFFEMVGYQSIHASHPHLAQAAVESHCPHVVLLDADLAERTGWEVCGLRPLRAEATEPFRFLLIEQAEQQQLREALEAGVDDFLHLPIQYGELLTRLRAAAGVLDFDRRALQQETTEQVTGLASRAELTTQLRRLLKHPSGRSQSVACAALDLDFFTRIEYAHGSSAGERLLLKVAEVLQSQCDDTDTLGCLGRDRFCAVLPGRDEEASAAWAEQARQAVAATVFNMEDGHTWHLTLSAGVSNTCETGHAARVLDQSIQALDASKRLGRNCVARWSELSAGDDQLKAESLFEHTTVSEVMAPCTVLLLPHETLADAAELLKRTRLEAIPVIDNEGLLLGVCERVRVAAMPDFQHATRIVRDVLTTNVQTYERDAGLSSLMHFFSHDERSLALVVEAKRPIGLVTCDSLVALSRPLSADPLDCAPGTESDDAFACDTTAADAVN